MDAKAARVPVSCNRDCGGGCPLLATVAEGRVVAIGPNPVAGPTRAGCVRGYQAHRGLYAPDRLATPLLREGSRGSGRFRQVGWDEALDRVAGGLRRLRDRYGPQALLGMGGSGSCRGALHNTGSLTARFLSLWGGYTDTLGSYSSAAAGYVTPLVLGRHDVGLDAATLCHSQLIVLLGANPSDCRLGCELNAHLRQARERGTPIIVIDPRRTRTAQEMASRWLPIRPGSDPALLLALLYVLLRDGLVDEDYISSHSVGFGLLRAHVLGHDSTPPKAPAWAEAVCGLPAAEVERLAHDYAQARPTALIPGLSIQRTVGGEEAIRLAVALQVATGNLGRIGGSTGALTWGRLPGPRCGRLPVPPNPVPARFPIYRWPDAVLQGRAGGFPSDLHGLYNVGSNLLVQGADLRKSARALEALDLVVTHDLFLTPTARYSDVVLPATHWLEREDIVFTGENTLYYSQQAVAPLPGARDDYDILADLAARLGLEPAFTEGRSAADWLVAFLAESEVPDHQAFRESGVYVAPAQERVGLADFAADPTAHPLPTPSGLVELAGERFVRHGLPAVPTHRPMPSSAEHPLLLVTPKSRYRVHSQNSNIPWFRERERHGLWLHPRDAAARGIVDHQLVLVTSPEGQVRVPAVVTDRIMPGVACLLEGVWPTFDGETEVAGSANALTSTEPTWPSGGSRTHSVAVQVQPALQ